MLYTISPSGAIPAGQDGAGVGKADVPGAGAGYAASGSAQVTAGLPAGMIAVRAADVVRPGGTAGGGAMLAGPASARPVTSGEVLVFSHPVTAAPAVVRQGGAVKAGGWLPDHVRLGELERHLGEGVIEDLVEAAVAAGRMPAQQRQRLMSLPLTIRLTVAMTLMPDVIFSSGVSRVCDLRCPVLDSVVDGALAA